MVSKNKKTDKQQQAGERTKSDSIRWTVGLFLLFVGLFVTAAVFFYYFNWKADQSILMANSSGNPHQLDVKNPCGTLGVVLAELLVGSSFGVFGILIPIMIIVVGVRIIRQRAILANHTLLSMFFVTILGSLTLGIAFADNGSLFSSTGLGGAYGIAIGDIITQNIGVVGAIIIVVLGWILIGVFVNRNFINTVNSAGKVMMDRSEGIVDVVKQRVAHPNRRVEKIDADQELYRDEVDALEGELDEDEVLSEPDYRRETSREVEVDESRFESNPRSVDKYEHTMVIDRGEEPAVVSQETFDEQVPLDDELDDEDLGPVSRSDSPFTEMTEDGEVLSSRGAVRRSFSSRGRVVMGSSGIIELDAPSAGEGISEGVANAVAAGEVVLGQELLSILDEGSQPSNEFELQPPIESETAMGGELHVDEPFEELGVESDSPLREELEPIIPQNAEVEDLGIVVEVEENVVELLDESEIVSDLYDPLKDLINYRNPPISLLEEYMSDSKVSDAEIFENKSRIEETLKYFGIPIQRIKATVGPTVTLYEIVQANGVKISKIQGLENDIAQSLKAFGIRIIAPIPGKGTIGIEVPNRDKQIVSLASAIRSSKFQEMKAELPIVVGRTIQNENYVFDLAKMPHLLVAGATGQGKSVGLNAIITSLLYKKHPSQLKFVMIDPKMVEFSLYAKLEKHFLAKMESEDEAIITDPKKAVYTLNALCAEMDTRLELCKKAETRNIAEYNAKFVARRLNPNKGHRYLPYIVVVVDEFADLILTAREVEAPVMRLAQKARAIGIHLIIATQRPDVKVITGGIKANFPARIAFRVMQMIDSRTIIDQPGANLLIGRGDMLFSKDGELVRIQCALVETDEVERIVDHISKQQGYTSAYYLPDYVPESAEPQMGSDSGAAIKYDNLFAEIARVAVSNGALSTSAIQRNFEVGFNRAGRIMMQLERAGVVGRQEGAKPRDILFHDMPSLEAKLQELGLF